MMGLQCRKEGPGEGVGVFGAVISANTAWLRGSQSTLAGECVYEEQRLILLMMMRSCYDYRTMTITRSLLLMAEHTVSSQRGLSSLQPRCMGWRAQPTTLIAPRPPPLPQAKIQVLDHAAILHGLSPHSHTVGAAPTRAATRVHPTHHERGEHKVQLVESPVGAGGHVAHDRGAHADELRAWGRVWGGGVGTIRQHVWRGRRFVGSRSRRAHAP